MYQGLKCHVSVHVLVTRSSVCHAKLHVWSGCQAILYVPGMGLRVDIYHAGVQGWATEGSVCHPRGSWGALLMGHYVMPRSMDVILMGQYIINTLVALLWS